MPDLLLVHLVLQLSVFDPRFPHGVRPVSGTRDPQQGRLVLHGENSVHTSFKRSLRLVQTRHHIDTSEKPKI